MWVTAKPDIFFRDYLGVQKPIKTLSNFLEFDNNFYRFFMQQTFSDIFVAVSFDEG